MFFTRINQGSIWQELTFSQVQKGWRIEYCAASENSTHCPEEFEEFFMQRRRWVASTLANMMLLMKKWNKITRFNHRVSAFFLLYQAVLLFATLIGPSSVILVVSGMGFNERKPVFGVSDKARFKPVSAATETS